MRLVCAACLLLATAQAALATSGPGCFRVTAVASHDVLNIRAAPSARSPVVVALDPGNHGIIAGTGPCRPPGAPPASRWCPVKIYDGDQTFSGWAKRQFLSPSDCP